MAFLLEDSLIKSSWIEQVVAPIAAHICYLTLLSEADDTTGCFIQLETSARAVAKASRNMTDVALRVMAESDDEVMRSEMGLLLEPLMISGQHVLLATQKISIQPEVREHREELVEATQNLLLWVVKVLSVDDDATVRKITTAAHWLLDCLKSVGDATDMPSLLKAFQVFSKALLLLHDLITNRVGDLRDHKQKDGVKTSVKILKRSVSMLHTATHTSLKHPTSQVAQKSKKYILQLVTSTVHNLILTLESSCLSRSTSSCGYYADRRMRVLRLLSDPESNWFKDRNFNVVVRDLVFHCMGVANCSQKETRSCLTAKCKLVLELWSEMRQSTCTDGQDAEDFHEKLRVSFIIQIHELDEAVVEATLHQVTDTFVTTSGPIEQLVNSVRNHFEAELGDGLDLDPIHTSFQTFVSFADRMTQVSRFVSALASDEKSLQSVENAVSSLVRIKDGLVPLLPELEGDSVQYHGALHKLFTFHQKWQEETEHLLNSLCDVINVKNFVEISVKKIKCDSNQCAEASKSNDLHILSKHLRLLMGRMSQVLQCVRRCVDKSDDPIYRNGLLVLVKQAEKSLAEVTVYATEIFNTNFQEEAFLSTITVAIKNVEVLHDGLDGLQHPHLLSPLREKARQLDSTTPVLSHKDEPKEVTNNQAEVQDLHHGDKDSADTLPKKKNPEPITDHHPETKIKKLDSKSAKSSSSTDLLPLLYEVVNTSGNKDVEALNIACTRILELSACYTQATKEATSITEENDHQELENLRSELVTLTPLLIQAAQETAMSSVRISDTVYKHSAQFSDLIRSTQQILLPVSGMWYHAIQAMVQSHTANMVDTCPQELSEVMCLCADTVELVTSTDIKVRSAESVDSITSLLSKLQKAQNNTKNLTDLLVSKSGQSDKFDGPCILWALSIQVLLASLDRILGTGSNHGRRRHQMTPKKWFTTMSENSLRIQEAARLSSLYCRDSRKAKLLKDRDDVKALTEVYLQAIDDLGIVSKSGVLKLARSEFLQRQLQMKMKSLCCVLSDVNEEYVPAVQHIVTLACSAVSKKSSQEIFTKFDGAAEFLLRGVETATESIQKCLQFIRDPRERSSLRFISDHLSFQMSEIVSMAKLIVEMQTVSESLSFDVQTQCWAAKARYLVEELYKVDGISPVTKDQIKLDLQGKVDIGVVQTDNKPSFFTKNTNPPGPVASDKTNPDLSRNKTLMCYTEPGRQRSTGVPVFSSMDPSLIYTSLFLKQEAERWDVQTNQIVQVTREMADKIYDMTRYLKKKGPIQSKEDFVSSAKELISSCQTVTLFVKVIAEHCLDQHSTKELCIIAERIVTITNQLTIISSVNAVTPACKSSDEILVKNAQNLLQTVIQGVRAAETACIKGLRQPEPNSEAAKAASLCIEWKKNLLIHRTQEQLNPETDDLGLRKTSQHQPTPSLAPPINVLERYK